MSERRTSKAWASVWALAALTTIAGCGDKKPPPPTAGSGSTIAAPTAPKLPSVASKLGDYETVDFGKSVDFAGFMAYHDTFMRSAAAAANDDKAKFAEMALIEVGSETDAFKREDKAKASKGAVDAMLAAPAKRLRLTQAAEPIALRASVSAYDMESESYAVTFWLANASVGYEWNQGGRHLDYNYVIQAPSIEYVQTCMECTREVVVAKKVSKAQAREIEAKLAPLRRAGTDPAMVAADFYVTVDKIVAPHWALGKVAVNIDAVGLRAPKQTAGEPLMLIDGPEFRRM